MLIRAKLYLNGFPKSGTHALDSIGKMILPRLADKNWLGNVDNHAFSTSLTEVNVPETLAKFPYHKYVKGHMAYSPEIAQAFQDNHFEKVFIFRDFRDVAVSAAFHVKNKQVFPNREFYQSLGFNELLRRIIVGDDTIAGVMERWEMFAPWLDEDWVLKIAYEDYVEHRKEVVGLFLRYVYGKAARYEGYQASLDPLDYKREVQRILDISPNTSPTYRKGSMGDWKNHFTEEHKELLKERDKNNWLIRLGYANDRNW